jgi:alanine racemase
MPRPILATVSRAALAHNLDVARRHAAGARILAVLKANAYGHGLVRAARALAKADGFAVLDLAEAVALREEFPDKPILLLEGIFHAADLSVVGTHGIHVVVHCAKQLDLLKAWPLPGPIDVFLKMNSGMNRLGIAPAAFGSAYRALKSIRSVRSVALMTHFADADGPSGIDDQIDVFNTVTTGLVGDRSAANSAALLKHSKSGFDWVRPGIMLYGCSPFADRAAQSFGLMPVMTMASEIIAIQTIQQGDTVGYGRSFVADRAMRIGVVACGYADGYPRLAPTGTPVLVDGRRARTVGRVSMDMITVDLSDHATAQIGTRVVLWGETLPADEVAAAAGTIGYELLCAVAPRVPMVEI